jgi:citrate synthase
VINKGLTSAEAAERLGVKPATIYAYVSRGLLHPERTSTGSTFDRHEVLQLARSARQPGGPGRVDGRRPDRSERGSDAPAFITELTLIEGGRLYYRGLDAVELSRRRSFEETAGWLWSGGWGSGEEHWAVPPAMADVLASVPDGATLVERFMAGVVAMSLRDDLRHDLTATGVAVAGRTVLAGLASVLPYSRAVAGGRRGEPMAVRVWRGLTRTARSGAGLDAVSAALVLAADHELAPSTLAARVAASFRADPYAVVLTGLGPASGSWYTGSTGAPTEVERLLVDAAEVGPERAIGERLRRVGEVPHGFGMPLYPDGDPRGRELLGRLEGVGGPDRIELVHRVVALGRERGFPPPNFDLGLGALSFCAEMAPGSGQAIFTLGKVAGWLAHAIEEYSSPTRFRSRADYVGSRPGGE